MLALLCALSVLLCSEAYPTGPPLPACPDMFPVGHRVDAMMTKAPFEILVSPNTYSPGSKVTVTINATNPDMIDMEGVFIQARSLNCSSKEAVGTFEQFPKTEDWLQLLACGGNNNSAVAHKDHIHTRTKTFNWIAPSKTVGEIYFRGTFVKNTTMFWTTVSSEFVTDSPGAELPPDHMKCEVVTDLSYFTGIIPMSSGSNIRLSAIPAIVFFSLVARLL